MEEKGQITRIHRNKPTFEFFLHPVSSPKKVIFCGNYTVRELCEYEIPQVQ